MCDSVYYRVNTEKTKSRAANLPEAWSFFFIPYNKHDTIIENIFLFVDNIINIGFDISSDIW